MATILAGVTGSLPHIPTAGTGGTAATPSGSAARRRGRAGLGSWRPLPAAGVADDAVEDPGGDGAAILGRGTDVVDRCDLGGERRGGQSGHLGGGWSTLQGGFGGAGANGVGAIEPSATRTSRRVPSPPQCQATASTTTLIACARRVPTLRNAALRPCGSGMRTRTISSSGASAVRR